MKKRSNFLRLVQRGLLVYMRPYWREHVLLLFLVSAVILLKTLIPLALQVLIDRAIPQRDMSLLMTTLGGLLALLALSTGAEILQGLVRSLCSQEVEADLRSQLFRHVQHLPMSQVDRYQAGEMQALFAVELVGLRDNLRDLIVCGFSPVVQLALTLVAMFALDWRIALVLLLSLPLFLKLENWAIDRSEAADLNYNLEDVAVAVQIQDNAAVYGLVKAFGLEEQVADEFDRSLRQGPRRTLNTYDLPLWKRGLQSPTFKRSMVVITNNFQLNALYMLVLAVGSWAAYGGELTVGTFSALLSLLLNLGSAASSLANYVHDTIPAGTYLERVEAVLNSPIVSHRGGEEPQSWTFRFEEVSFAYGDHIAPLRNLTCQFPQTGMVALVGRSGCGKSTLMKLMLRFYAPTQGQIRLGGVELSRVPFRLLHDGLGVVLQDHRLLSGSVAANLRLVKPDATLEEMQQAAREADIHDVLAALPQGYDTPLGDGGRRLSPGQRQRLALAQALLRKPRILLLDEITASLDPESEGRIHRTLMRLAQDRLVVQLTHRLAGLVEADLILVLEGGTLTEQGDHPSLLQRGGAYARLWKAQTGFAVSQDGRRAEVSPERLASIPLFTSLSPEELEILARCFVSDTVVTGQYLCQEGQLGELFYIVVRGRVKVTVRGHDGQTLTLATLIDGDFCGEDAMLDASSCYSTTVQVETDSLVLTLARDDFRRLAGRLEGSLQATALARTLTLSGRRGRRPSRLESTWETILKG